MTDSSTPREKCNVAGFPQRARDVLGVGAVVGCGGEMRTGGGTREGRRDATSCQSYRCGSATALSSHKAIELFRSQEFLAISGAEATILLTLTASCISAEPTLRTSTPARIRDQALRRGRSEWCKFLPELRYYQSPCEFQHTFPGMTPNLRATFHAG